MAIYYLGSKERAVGKLSDIVKIIWSILFCELKTNTFNFNPACSIEKCIKTKLFG
jgi:hypothetical protein